MSQEEINQQVKIASNLCRHIRHKLILRFIGVCMVIGCFVGIFGYSTGNPDIKITWIALMFISLLFTKNNKITTEEFEQNNYEINKLGSMIKKQRAQNEN